ncbi:UNVERIFIED_CONTAM: molybdopterin molybdotransferase [Brevibacillus sp. OAP136]
MRFTRETISVEKAVQMLLAATAHPLPEEEISLYEAHGRVMARSLQADSDMPPFDRSPLDGYAVRAEDTVHASVEHPVWLNVIETIAAGQLPSKQVLPNTAIRIMTGAQMPEGADAVVMFEQTENPGEISERVGVKRAMKAGENISRRGEEITRGTQVIERGERINGGVMALLAAFGYVRIPVVRRPRVGLLITGNELLSPEEPLRPGQIRNSNGPMLAGMIADAGGVPLLFPPLSDHPGVAKEALDQLVDQVDLFVTTGGVSVGDFDGIAAMTDDDDVQLLFNRVAMRPGSPTTALMYRNKPLCGLSGNPGACFLGFELFVRPLLAQMMGQTKVLRHSVRATLGSSCEKPCPYPRYLRGRLQVENKQLVAYPDKNDKAGNLTTLKNSECFIIIPAGGRGRSAGEEVEVILHAMPRFGGES